MDHDRKSFALCVSLAAASLLAAPGASANPIGLSHAAFPSLLNRTAMVAPPPEGEVIIGIASFYDTPGELTASGEMYDGDAFTAAAQLEIRDKFGGIRFGRLYQPCYAIAESNGKRAIIKFNDVGPLRPGRKFDLSRAAMEHFGGIERGLLPDFKIVLLPPGQDYTPGPLVDVQTTSMEVIDAHFSAPTVTLPPTPYVGIGPYVEKAAQVAGPPARPAAIADAPAEQKAEAAHAQAAAPAAETRTAAPATETQAATPAPVTQGAAQGLDASGSGEGESGQSAMREDDDAPTGAIGDAAAMQTSAVIDADGAAENCQH